MKKTILLIGLILSIQSQAEEFLYTHDYQFGNIVASAQSQGISLGKISCGGYHCYTIHNGTIWSVGDNSYGQLGRGGDNTVWADTTVPADYVSAGAYHGYALYNGEIWSVGNNNEGQLGINSNLSNSATWLNTTFTADKVVAGVAHGYAIKNNELWSVGYNVYGQLGLGDENKRLDWTNTNLPVSDITSGAFHGYAVSNGNIWSAGYNYYGQLSRTDLSCMGTSPCEATTFGDTGISASGVKIYGGYYNGYLLKNNTVWSAGANYYGQLGLSTVCTGSVSCFQTTFADTTFNATDISAGHSHVYAVQSNNVWGLGYNIKGQLATGNTSDQLIWHNLNQTASNVYAGYYFGLFADGSNFYSVGENEKGQLGIGHTANQTSIQTVNPL